MTSEYCVKISNQLQAPEWDKFVLNAPGGHHVQTSLWAQLKASLGWSVTRVIVREGDQIVGGAQVLIHHLPIYGAVGYVTKGPILALSHDKNLIELILDQLRLIRSAAHLQLLVIQPSTNGECFAERLTQIGFTPSSLALAPTATIVLDLMPELEQIAGNMKRQTRQNIRRSEREEISVRDGTRDDLATFYRLHVETSRRQQFDSYPEEYLARMWDLFEPRGFIRLLVAEYRKEAVSALLLVPFGETVIAKLLGWSGEHADRRPNDGLFWAAVRWSKANGYRRFDFEGIDRTTGEAVLSGTPLPESFLHSPDFFKLGFGGKVILQPKPYVRFSSALVKWAFNKAAPELEGHSLASRYVDRFRKSREIYTRNVSHSHAPHPGPSG